MEDFKGKFVAMSCKLFRTEIIFSSHGAPGGGGHSAYIYSSTPGEQAGAYHCRNLIVTRVRATAIPTTRQAYRVVLTGLLEYVDALAYVAGPGLKLGNGESAATSSSMYFSGNLAFEAMRQKLLGVIIEDLFVLDCEQ